MTSCILFCAGKMNLGRKKTGWVKESFRLREKVRIVEHVRHQSHAGACVQSWSSWRSKVPGAPVLQVLSLFHSPGDSGGTAFSWSQNQFPDVAAHIVKVPVNDWRGS